VLRTHVGRPPTAKKRAARLPSLTGRRSIVSFLRNRHGAADPDPDPQDDPRLAPYATTYQASRGGHYPDTRPVAGTGEQGGA
jgi:hypothetical protein